MTKVIRFNRSQYALDWKKMHHRAEQQVYPYFHSALKQQTKQVVDYIKLRGVSSLRDHLTLLISPQPIEQAYQKCYSVVGVKGATFTFNKINQIVKGKSYSDMELKDGPGFFSEYWRKLMGLFYQTQSAERVQGVNETTRDHIKTLLDQSQDLTISEQATFMVNSLNNPEFNRMRALRIARTETTTSANYGAFLGAQSTDYEVGKIWLVIMDMNTRPDHAAMDGLPPIGIEDDFEVGSSLMKYPGDMSAPVGEVANCRCSLAIVPLMGENGLPILKAI